MQRPASFALLLLGVLLAACRAELPDQDCPDDCDCHYFRVNWVTDCSESNLTSIPTEDEGLSLNVYILDMNANIMHQLDPFPADLKVRSLQLAENMLTSVGKDDFSTLMYLIDLDLSANNIRSIHPEAFLNNHGLITLEVQKNPLEPVEGPFIISRSLHYLDLSDCTLTKLSPLFFQNITAVNRLDLSGNPLRVLDPDVFDALNNLEYLKLKNCSLTTIHPMAFALNEHLKKIELSENNLIGVKDWIMVLGPLMRLESLDLRRSGIINLPDNLFVNNTFLRSLILAENELRDLDVSSTLSNNLQHLDYLDLSNCRLTGPLSEDAFANATNLRTLMLTGNRLSAADLAVALAPLSRLHKLSLKNCSLTRLPANTFHRFNDLAELDISENPLNDAFTGLLSPLDTLQYLNMGNSHLERVSKTTFSKMTSLKTLILSGNPLESLEPGLFQNLTKLEVLELNNCGLSRLNSTVFPDNFTYPDLEELRLASNPLIVPSKGSFLPRQLRRLKTLDLSNCNLTYIKPTVLSSFSNITRLLLPGNNLTNTKEDALDFIQNLRDLEYLDLSSNKLNYITPKVFKNNRALRGVKLVGNPWKCGCNIADMWRWALQEKGDLAVLVGSRTLPEEVGTGGNKRKKGLWCHFDKKLAPVKNITHRKSGRTEFVDNVNRTWFRYVRESACDAIKILPIVPSTDTSQYTPHLATTAARVHSAESPPAMVLTILGLGTVVLLVWAAVYLHSFGRRLSRSPSDEVALASSIVVNHNTLRPQHNSEIKQRK